MPEKRAPLRGWFSLVKWPAKQFENKERSTGDGISLSEMIAP
jgi:hypothetical protein